jgi:hypothetical protein
MKIVGMYSFNGGEEAVRQRYPALLAEVEQVVNAVASVEHQTKTSREKTMPGRQLYSPRALNAAFKALFVQKGWQASIRIPCEYPTAYYVDSHRPEKAAQGAFRELDFVKEKSTVWQVRLYGLQRVCQDDNFRQPENHRRWDRDCAGQRIC